MSERTPRLLRVALDGRALQPDFPLDADRGIGLYARELLRALAQRNDLVITLWVDPGHAVPEGIVPPGVRLQRFPPTLIPMADRLASNVTLPWIAGRQRHDVFHWLTHAHAPAFPPSGSVITVHDLIHEQHAELYPGHRSAGFRTARRLESMAIRGAGMLVTMSRTIADDLQRLHQVEPDRVQVTSPGISARFAPVSPAEVAGVCKHHELDAPFILYRGGYDARADVLLLIDAFARLRRRRKKPVLLVLAGDLTHAPMREAILARAEEHRLGRALRLIGAIPHEHLPRLLTAARVFAFPSRAEGFGFPPLEAMACGTPVVSTTGGALAEVLGEAAFTVPTGDVKAFALALARVLDDEEIRARLREDGRVRAAAHTWARTADETVAAYRALLARARR